MPEPYSTSHFHRLFRETRRALGVVGQAVRIELEKIQPGLVLTLTHVTVENRSAGYTKCRLGIRRSGRYHYLDELTSIAAEELAVSRSDIQLRDGDVFFSELTGTTLNNELIMTCVGWELDL